MLSNGLLCFHKGPSFGPARHVMRRNWRFSDFSFNFRYQFRKPLARHGGNAKFVGLNCRHRVFWIDQIDFVVDSQPRVIPGTNIFKNFKNDASLFHAIRI